MLALVCQRHANCVSLGALRYSFCNVRDFIVVAFNARLASEESVKFMQLLSHYFSSVFYCQLQWGECRW